MVAFWGLYGFLLLERICEQVIARRNGRWILEQGGVEHDAPFTRRLILFHATWFVSFLAEGLLQPAASTARWPAIAGVAAALQGLRYWCIASLGRFWNTRVLVLPQSPVIRKGPYRFLKHPNYLVVLIEIPLYPLLVGCWATALFFGAANVAMLRRRTRKEDDVLAAYTRA